MRRIIALLLILVTVFVMVGCGKEKRQIIKLTLSTEDSEAILAAAGIMLPDAETAAGANSTIKWLSWFDQFHNYSEDEVVNTGYSPSPRSTAERLSGSSATTSRE